MSEPFRVIFVDCDSTLSAIEGIDELARRAGMFEEIEALTRRAMDGELALEDVYGLRLERVRPSQSDIGALASLYVERVVEGAPQFVSALHALGKDVHVVSGGVRQALLPLASHLRIPDERVHGVSVVFAADGNYAGFEKEGGLHRSGGKAALCARVLRATPGRSAFVGDGKTDLEARPPCDVMIGFGGVVAREIVRREADAFVDDASILRVLPLLLTGDEAARVREMDPDLLEKMP